MPASSDAAPLDQFTDEDWRDLIAHNLDSVFFVGRPWHGT